jgi:hypothetical protein
MKTYTCDKFTGHYPVGSAAIVRANDAVEAADKLNEALREDGLVGDAEIKDMIVFPIGKTDDVRILVNGNY